MGVCQNSYLEIGVSNGIAFRSVIAPSKVGVDPNPAFNSDYVMTSDEYFSNHRKDSTFDLIFIDGLHEASQVQRDIENSLLALNEGGTILCHDCNPVSQLPTAKAVGL